MLSTLVAGYLMLSRQAPLPEADELLLARKRFELELLSLPRGEYPNVAASVPELVDAQFTEPHAAVEEIVDFLVAAVEAMRDKKKRSRQASAP
jgi:hypothetical protein